MAMLLESKAKQAEVITINASILFRMSHRFTFHRYFMSFMKSFSFEWFDKQEIYILKQGSELVNTKAIMW